MIFKFLLLIAFAVTFVQPRVTHTDLDIISRSEVEDLQDVIFKLQLTSYKAISIAERIYKSHSVESVSEEDIKALQGVVDKLKGLVSKAIEKAKTQLLKLKDKVVEKANVIVEKIKEHLSNQFGGFISTLNGYKEQAKKIGIEIKHCVKDGAEKLTDIPKEFIKGIIQCGKDQIAEGKAIIDTAISDIKGTIEEAKALIKKYKACSGVTCKAKVVVEIGKAGVKIPSHITKAVTSGIEFVSTLYTDLELCAAEKVNKGVSQGQTLLSNITTCIQSSIKPKALKYHKLNFTRIGEMRRL